MATLPEILIILATIAIVFGVGKLTQIGNSLGKTGKELKKGFKEGLEGEKPIDITPTADKRANGSKPGQKKQSVDDANIEEQI